MISKNFSCHLELVKFKAVVATMQVKAEVEITMECNLAYQHAQDTADNFPLP